MFKTVRWTVEDWDLEKKQIKDHDCELLETETFSVQRPQADGRRQFEVTPDFAWKSQPVVL